ncbi:hypothetical protein C0T31_08790 [Dysgonamonadaceae bacterium]|nr:hypothetical protein C0T31_08790 [Dysgonamonadaceae bacterium]
MKTEGFIDEMIEKEKQIESNPFLSTRIMSKIATENTPLNKRVYFFRLLVVVASIALVMRIGVSIGKIYDENKIGNITLNINDYQIENLFYYMEAAYE